MLWTSRVLWVVAVIAAPACSAAAAETSGTTDSQVWTELDVVKWLGRGLSVTGIGVGRFSGSLANPTLAALGVDLDYVEGHWTFTAGYRQKAVRHGPELDSISRIALAAAVYTKQIGRSTLVLRGRLENTRDATGNPWRARIRAEYRRAIGRRGPVSYLFVNDEEFFQAGGGEWSRNRFQAGLDLGIGARLALRVFYQRQQSWSPVSSRVNALGVTVRITME